MIVERVQERRTRGQRVTFLEFAVDQLEKIYATYSL